MVNAKRMLALIMAGTFLFQSSLAVGAAGWNGQVSQVMTTGEQEVVTVEGISVEARFSSNHIRFNAVEGATGYNIWRCAEQEGAGRSRPEGCLGSLGRFRGQGPSEVLQRCTGRRLSFGHIHQASGS